MGCNDSLTVLCSTPMGWGGVVGGGGGPSPGPTNLQWGGGVHPKCSQAVLKQNHRRPPSLYTHIHMHALQTQHANIYCSTSNFHKTVCKEKSGGGGGGATWEGRGGGVWGTDGIRPDILYGILLWTKHVFFSSIGKFSLYLR
jgi:hypothetical protein